MPAVLRTKKLGLTVIKRPQDGELLKASDFNPWRFVLPAPADDVRAPGEARTETDEDYYIAPVYAAGFHRAV